MRNFLMKRENSRREKRHPSQISLQLFPLGQHVNNLSCFMYIGYVTDVGKLAHKWEKEEPQDFKPREPHTNIWV